MSLSLKDAEDADAARIVSAWDGALNTKTDDPKYESLQTYRSSHKRFIHFLRGSAAAAILSLLSSFGILIAFFITRIVVRERRLVLCSYPVVRRILVVSVEAECTEVRTTMGCLQPGEKLWVELDDGVMVEAKVTAEGGVIELDGTTLRYEWVWFWKKEVWYVIAAALWEFSLLLSVLVLFHNGLASGAGMFDSLVPGLGNLFMGCGVVLKVLCVPVIGGAIIAGCVVISIFVQIILPLWCCWAMVTDD